MIDPISAGIAWACIAPHGGDVIPELASDPACMAITRAGMEALASSLSRAHVETLVVITPHGFAIEDCISVSVTANCSGELMGDGDRRVALTHSIHRELANGIINGLKQCGVTPAQLAYLDSGDPAETLPMDWGVLVPLWFLNRSGNLPIVVLCPDRTLPRSKLIAAGASIAEAAETAGIRIGLVCSADQGHGHHPEGPYGFAPESAEHDLRYKEFIERHDLEDLLSWEDEWIERALPDSYWQTLMLFGALDRYEFAHQVHSYEAPTYFGMLTASYEVTGLKANGLR